VELPELLWELCRRRKTGVLHVLREPVSRLLYIQEGQIVFAASSDPNDRLGELLLRRGTIDLDQLETALRELRSGKRLGTLLVEAGSLTSEGLVEAVLEQVKAVTLSLLRWDRGEYAFEEGPLPTDEVITLRMNTGELLLQGMRGIRSVSRVARGVGPGQTTYRLNDDWASLRQPLELSEGEQALLERLRAGEATVEALCREVALSSFDVERTLWAFKLLGIARRMDRPPQAAGTVEYAGRIDAVTLPELLAELARTRATGSLRLQRHDVERSIDLSRGRCTFAASNAPDDGLVPELFRRGLLSHRDRERARQRTLAGRTETEALRSLGTLDDADLRHALGRQVRGIVFDSLQWTEGDYRFEPGVPPAAPEIAVDIDVAGLLAEGLRRVDSWTRAVRGCGGVDNPLTLTPNYLEVLDAMDAGVEEWQIVNALKAPQTARRACRACELPPLRVCQILWTLKLLGAVETRPIEGEDHERDAAAEPSAIVPPAAHEEVTAALRELPGPGYEPAAAAAADDDDETAARITVAVEEDGPPSADLARAIARFNAMHRVLYRALRTEIGAGAANFVRSCCVQIGPEATDVLDGVELHTDGSWDEAALERVARDKHVDDPWPAYQRLLDREYVQLKPHLGDARALELKQQIWEMHRPAPRADG
jgi:hypothetical protein